MTTCPIYPHRAEGRGYLVPASLHAFHGKVVRHIQPGGDSYIIFPTLLDAERAIREAGFEPSLRLRPKPSTKPATKPATLTINSLSRGLAAIALREEGIKPATSLAVEYDLDTGVTDVLDIDQGLGTLPPMNAAADRANEVLGRLLTVSKGSGDDGPTSTQLVQALFTICLTYESHRSELRRMMEETSRELVSVRRQLEWLVTNSEGPPSR